jgi:hypothetical protein
MEIYGLIRRESFYIVFLAGNHILYNIGIANEIFFNTLTNIGVNLGAS